MDSKRRRDIHNHLLDLSPSAFERFVAQIWEQMGWETVVTPTSNDDGIDIVATKSGIHQEKAAIQAKRYSPSNKIGRPDIQQYDTLRRQDPSVDIVVVVTTSEFSDKAKDLAEKLNVKTVNGSAIATAALENLSDERLSDIFENKNKSEEVEPTEPDQGANKNSGETRRLMSLSSDLEREDLNPVETQLAEIYEKNWQKRSEDSDGAPLHFYFKETPEHLEIYQFYTGLHSIEFKELENSKLTSKKALKMSKSVSRTAKKHGWEFSRTGRLINIKPNGDIEKNFNPEYEARFTNIVINEFLDSSLDQIRILTETTDSPDTIAESYRLAND
jgi:hypothetical protein